MYHFHTTVLCLYYCTVCIYIPQLGSLRNKSFKFQVSSFMTEKHCNFYDPCICTQHHTIAGLRCFLFYLYRERERGRAFILECLQYLAETVDSIAWMTQVNDTAIELQLEGNFVMVRFTKEMEHVFNSMIKIKNQL